MKPAQGFLALLLLTSAAVAAPLTLDERPAGEEEWGYRPADAAVSETTPPGFLVAAAEPGSRLGISSARGDAAFEAIEHRRGNRVQRLSVRPARSRPARTAWRYRGSRRGGPQTELEPAADVHGPGLGRGDAHAAARRTARRGFPSRIRDCSSGRKTCRELRELAQGPMNDQFEQLVAPAATSSWHNPPPTAEPPKYPAGRGIRQRRVARRSGGATGRTRSPPWTAPPRSASRACWAARRSTASWPNGSCWTAPSGTRRARPATATTTRRACRTPTTSPGPTRSSTTC